MTDHQEADMEHPEISILETYDILDRGQSLMIASDFL